jgi:hypothetical protein
MQFYMQSKRSRSGETNFRTILLEVIEVIDQSLRLFIEPDISINPFTIIRGA